MRRFHASHKLLAAVTAVGLISAGAVGVAGASAGPDSAHPRVAAPKAHAASKPNSYSIDIQAVYDAAGNPSLVANFSPDGGLAKPRWSTCSPPDLNVCTPTSATQSLNAGATSAGTVFQATATYKGRTYVARTAPWLGTVRAVIAPRLTGQPLYDATVTPYAANWTGGWQSDPTYKPHDGDDSGGHGPDFDFLNVEACRTRAARHCVNLSAPAGYGFSKRPPVVDAWFTGWYLFAIDGRFAYDTSFAESGYRNAATAPPVRLGATAAHSAPFGPVIGPPAPKVSILRDGILRRGRVLVARVRCSVRCQAFLQVSDNDMSSDAHVTLTGSRLVGVPRRQLRRGSLNVEINVGAGPLVHGKMRLR